MLFLRQSAGGDQDLSLKLKMRVNPCATEGSQTLSPFFLITSGSNLQECSSNSNGLSNHLGLLLKCRFWFIGPGVGWESAFQTSSQVLPLLLHQSHFWVARDMETKSVPSRKWRQWNCHFRYIKMSKYGVTFVRLWWGSGLAAYGFQANQGKSFYRSWFRFNPNWFNINQLI